MAFVFFFFFGTVVGSAVSAVVATQRASDDVASCLVATPPSGECSGHGKRDCLGLIYDSSCLTTRIPRNLASDLERVICCFSCCLLMHQNLYGIGPGENRIEMQRQLHLAFPSPQTYDALYVTVSHKSPSAHNVLFSSLFSSLSVSNYVVTTLGAAGKGAVQHFATMTGLRNMSVYGPASLATPEAKREELDDLKSWSSLKSTRSTLITPTLTTCTNNVPAREIASSASWWFSTQLPCSLVEARPNSSHLAVAALLAKKPHEKRLAANWPAFLRLLPGGVRSPQAFFDAAKGKPTVRSVLLDCSCARLSHGHDPRVLGYLHAFEPLCEPVPPPSQSNVEQQAAAAAASASASASAEADAEAGGGVEGKFLREIKNEQDAVAAADLARARVYYASLRRAKFVLSLSSPSGLGNCEWEAAASGAQVVMAAALHALLERNPYTSELYKTLPVVVLDVTPGKKTSTSATADALSRAASASASNLGIEAAFFPFWLHKLSKGLLRGKTHQFMDTFARSMQTYVEGGPASVHRQCPRGLEPTPPALASATAATSTRLDVVVAVCCESPSELTWLDLLAQLPGVAVHLFYKCPNCIPRRFTLAWLPSLPRSQTPLGTLQVEDLPLSRHANIEHRPLFDKLSNGKEVTAYLTYLVERSASASAQLPPFVLFLHAAPDTHAHFGLFFRAITYALCAGPSQAAAINSNSSVKSSAGDKFYDRLFLQINFQYRSGNWGQCCGKQGGCKRSLWKHLFGQEAPRPDAGAGEWWREGLPGVPDMTPLLASLQMNASTGKGLSRAAHFRHQQLRKRLAWETRRKNKKHQKDKKQQQQQRRRRLIAAREVLAISTHDLLADSKFKLEGSTGADDWGQGQGFAAYSSAQFLVSRPALLSLPKGFWLKMLMAINGSAPLPHCSLSTAKGKDWGGHQLTGQYERIWHVLFGYPRRMTLRSEDRRLPRQLRLDCKPLGESWCQEELGKIHGSSIAAEEERRIRKVAFLKGAAARNDTTKATGKTRQPKRRIESHRRRNDKKNK